MSIDRFGQDYRQYLRGGLHPVHLGDVFHGRYEVLRKIGHGRYSTVWLAQDQEDLKFRALKIMKAGCCGAAHGVFARHTLKRLQDSHLWHPGHAHVPQLMDSFEHEGPNGVHVCLVFPVLGETLATFRGQFPSSRLPNEIMREFALQLILALDLAHGSGVLHTDIKADNIFVKIEDESVISQVYLPNNPVDPSAFDPTTHPATIPCQPLMRHYIAEGANPAHFEIVLGGWGESNWHPSEGMRSVTNQPPEVLIRAAWHYRPSTDLWNLGVVLLEAFRGVRIFRGKAHPGEAYNVRQHLHEIVDVFGPLPQSLLERGDQILVQHIFDETGRVKGLPPIDRSTLQDANFMLDLGERDRQESVAFLRSLMTVDPNERDKIMDLLAGPWFCRRAT